MGLSFFHYLSEQSKNEKSVNFIRTYILCAAVQHQRKRDSEFMLKAAIEGG